ncbi:MAG: CopG family transcriptional regulator [Hyphomonadaceae bacterium]|nr:CopG family transcriptional regulator [Hyphomonadaceae bacterium]
MQRSGRFNATVRDEADMPAPTRRLGVPDDLASCHAVEVEGYVIEGRVPPEDIVRLLEQRPTGVRGLAVPGMPIGSPGMERTGGGRDACDVIAFRDDGGRDVFTRYPALS